MKMKRKTLVFAFIGKHGGGLKVEVLPKHMRYKGVDGIRLKFRSSEDAKKHPNECWSFDMKDWEALAIIEGLTKALQYKKGHWRK